jgi:hypothetical protein
VLAGTNLIAAVIFEQSKVSEQGEEGEEKTLLSVQPLLSPAIDHCCEVRLLPPPCLLSFTDDRWSRCHFGLMFPTTHMRVARYGGVEGARSLARDLFLKKISTRSLGYVC